MTKYYKQLNENGKVAALLTFDYETNNTDPLVVEITAEEYEAIRAEWGKTAKVETEEEKAAKIAKMRERSLKAKAYDIVTGVSE